MDEATNAAAERIRTLAADLRAGRGRRAIVAGSGRGLVVVAGGARMFTNAYVLLHVLRHHLRSQLAVELWYLGQSEISPAMAALLEPLDIRLVDARPLIAAAGATIRDGWQLKAFALANSRFAEVLLLDADQVPIADPEQVFDWPQYREAGAVFWPDVVDLRRDNPIWPLLGLAPARQVSFESGQLLVDRRRHAEPLAAALQINEAAEDLYTLIYGDKDTYLLAWQLLGAAYALVPHRPYADEHYLVQRDFAGAALFQHRTNAKWQYGAEQRKLAGFVHEEACLAALDLLQRQWSGRVFTPPDRSVDARAAEQVLIDTGPFVLEVAGEPALELHFSPHGEIGEGRAADRLHWWIEGDARELRLILSAGAIRHYDFVRGADGIWSGTRHRRPVAGATLMPGTAGERPVASDIPGLVDDLLRAGGVFGGAHRPLTELAAAFDLLGQVVPGVPERLLMLASRQSDPEIAMRMRTLAAGLGRSDGLEEADRSFRFETGYVRAELPE